MTDQTDAAIKQLTTIVTRGFSDVRQGFSDFRHEVRQGFSDVNTTLNAILETNPRACLKRKNPSLVTSPRITGEAIRRGGAATWTIVKERDTPTSYRFFAIGSKHCAFYYETITNGCCFVSLPAEVVKAGVVSVDLQGNIHSVSEEHDAVVISLAGRPASLSEDDITEYNPFNGPQIPPRSFVAGQSESGRVIGDGIVRDLNQNHYLFVQEQGEPGNSGTLMFVQGLNNPLNLKIIGTYFGIASGLQSLRHRGIIAPLPPSLLAGAGVNSYSPIPLPPNISSLRVDDTGVLAFQRNVELLPVWCEASDSNYYELYDQGGIWPGVIIGVDTEYRGSSLSGSARSK